MPVLVDEAAPVDAGSTSGAKERRGHAWLLPLAALLALLLALPIIPVIRPVKWQLGSRMLVIGTAHVQGTSPPHGLQHLTIPTSGTTTDNEGVEYVTQGPLRITVLRVWDWAYYVAWFTGRPKPPAGAVPIPPAPAGVRTRK